MKNHSKKIQSKCVMYILESTIKKLQQHKPELKKKYLISRLGVFGSCTRGEATNESDIDIAVEI